MGRVKLNNSDFLFEEASDDTVEIEKGAFFIKNRSMLNDRQKKLYNFIEDNFNNPVDVLQTVFVWIKENNLDPNNSQEWKTFTKELGLNLIKLLTKFRFIVGK